MLDLTNNALVGQVPASIGNLTQLRYLFLGRNQLRGKVYVSFANLTKLIELNLSNNYFELELLPDISRFHNLEVFLGGNFFGSFPTSLFTIPSLQRVDLRGNNFTGPIDFGNMSLSSRLQIICLADNKFDGPIPESISKFQNLEQLDLSNNFFSGPFPTSISTIPSLQKANLARNQFKGPIHFWNISSSSSLSVLYLSDNKFDGEIPESISQFLNLRVLDLSNNKLEGKVPGCLWRMASLKLSDNSLNSFGKSSEVLHRRRMRELRLDSNLFHGSFPHWICEIRSLQVLDLSGNSFNGSIHPCLRNFTDSLRVLNLRNNRFSGILPDAFGNATILRELDVSRNRLEGELPKTLINCEAMEFLNVGGNKFKDKFPSWLGSLSLSVLILKSNQFYGPLYHHHISIGFQNIKVIDVSHNNFTGTLPTFYFSNWFEMSQMTALNPENDDIYMGYPINIIEFWNPRTDFDTYSSSMEMVQEGVDIEFEKIRIDFRAIDFSRNKFDGKIPESIGLLKGLRVLNLSGNAFKSNIPQSLTKLTNLEALDLSQNQLSGQIPRDLDTLDHLSTMNFSYNNLEGPIPQVTQFDHQKCSSFMGNPRLNVFGDFCVNTDVPNPTPQESKEMSKAEKNVINWVTAAITYGPGVLCGLFIGYIFSSYMH